MHARIKVRLPIENDVVRRNDSKPETPDPRQQASSTTTVGRVIFNDILPEAWRSTTWRSSAKAAAASSPTATSSSAAADDRSAGPHEGDWASANRPRGLSFATDDLRTPAKKQEIIDAKQKEGRAASRRHVRAASSPSASATTRSSTSGRTPATQITKQMMTTTLATTDGPLPPTSQGIRT